MNELTTDELNKLQTFAATTLLNKLKSKVPAELKNNNQELIAEIWNAYFYLLNNYKQGKLSRTSYCFMYAVEIANNNIWKEHKIQKSFVGLDNLTKEPQTMKTPETEMIECEDKIELSNRIKDIIDLMPPNHFEIATMYMRGITMEKIAEVHKIAKSTVKKILQKYAK